MFPRLYCPTSLYSHGCIAPDVNADGGCTDTVRLSALEVDWKKNPLPHRGVDPVSVSRLAFQSDAVPTEPSRPIHSLEPKRTAGSELNKTVPVVLAFSC